MVITELEEVPQVENPELEHRHPIHQEAYRVDRYVAQKRRHHQQSKERNRRVLNVPAPETHQLRQSHVAIPGALSSSPR